MFFELPPLAPSRQVLGPVPSDLPLLAAAVEHYMVARELRQGELLYAAGRAVQVRQPYDTHSRRTGSHTTCIAAIRHVGQPYDSHSYTGRATDVTPRSPGAPCRCRCPAFL